MLGAGEIIVLIGVGVLIWNAKRLPQMGRSLRDSFIGFRKGLSGEEDPRPTRDVNQVSGKKPDKNGSD